MTGLIDILSSITIVLGVMLAALAIATGTVRRFTRGWDR